MTTLASCETWPKGGLDTIGRCPVCKSSDRVVLYEKLKDRLFGAPGEWTMYICSDCGSAYLDPRPTAATIGLAYANYETHRPAVDVQQLEPAPFLRRLRNGYLNTKYGYRLEPASRLGYLVLSLLPPPLRLEWDHFARHLPRPKPSHADLLDVGCGNGDFLLRARSQGWSTHGIDFDAEALRHAEQAGINVVRGPIEAKQFQENRFDAITSHQVIEHVHSPEDFLDALYLWLKPGGRVWIGTPNISSDLREEFGPDWYPLQAPGHLQIFSPAALTGALRSAGFVDVQILARGYNESHYHRVCTKLRFAKSGTSNESVTSGREASLSLIERIRLEFRVWKNPERGSDLVVVGMKPERP